MSKLKAYDTLAVRYRPKFLEEVIGQRKVVTQLEGMFKSGKIARSIIISGAYGSGKTTFARIIAKYVNCSEDKICGEEDKCLSCTTFDSKTKINHPDVTYVNVGDETGVDKMRTLIKGSNSYPRYNFRVFILDEVHQASKASQTALLIPLDPSPMSIFILCTTKRGLRELLEEDYMKHISKLDQANIWIEIARGLSRENPEIFIKGLHETGQLKTILPEVDALFGVPQPPEHHPEIDTGIHTLMTLKRAAELSDDLAVRYAALTHDLGKALTNPKKWPKQHGHEALGIAPAQAITKRLDVPKEISILAEHVVRDHVIAHRALELKPDTIVKLLERINATQNPDMFEKFILVAQADAQGRLGFEDRPYPQAKLLKSALQAVRDVEINFSDKDLTGKVIRQKKVEAVKEVKNNMTTSLDSQKSL